MPRQLKRATVHFDPNLHNALKLKELTTSQSMTEIVNQAGCQALADYAADIATFEEIQDEPLVSCL